MIEICFIRTNRFSGFIFTKLTAEEIPIEFNELLKPDPSVADDGKIIIPSLNLRTDLI